MLTLKKEKIAMTPNFHLSSPQQKLDGQEERLEQQVCFIVKIQGFEA